MIDLPFIVNSASTQRVKNPLPAPTVCRYCNGKVVLASNARIYGKRVGKWAWVYHCADCDSYVGLHPFTDIPLGTLADAELRALRSAFKDVFNPLCTTGGGRWSRSKAYKWLAAQMKISTAVCHGGWFDNEQCIAATEICRVQLSRWAAQEKAQNKDQETTHEHTQREERVPDWYDERNHYLAPNDIRPAQADPRESSKSPPWE